MLFNNPRKAVVMIVIFLALFFAGIIGVRGCAHAYAFDAPYMQIAAGSTYIRGTAPVMDLAATWKSSQDARNFWKLDLDIIGSSTFRGQDAPNNFAVRGLYVGGFRQIDLGLGLAWLQNPQPYNGSPVNFTLEIAYRMRRFPFTIAVSHISNAGTRLPNYGRDFLTVGYRFKG